MTSGEKMGRHTNTRQNEFVEKQLNNAHTQHHCKSHSLARTHGKKGIQKMKNGHAIREKERMNV